MNWIPDFFDVTSRAFMMVITTTSAERVTNVTIRQFTQFRFSTFTVQFFSPFFSPLHNALQHHSHRKSLPHRHAPQPPAETAESRCNTSDSRVDATPEADRVSAGSSSGSGANYEYPVDPGPVAGLKVRGDTEEDPEPPSYPPPPPPEEEEEEFENG